MQNFIGSLPPKHLGWNFSDAHWQELQPLHSHFGTSVKKTNHSAEPIFGETEPHTFGLFARSHKQSNKAFPRRLTSAMPKQLPPSL